MILFDEMRDNGAVYQIAEFKNMALDNLSFIQWAFLFFLFFSVLFFMHCLPFFDSLLSFF